MSNANHFNFSDKTGLFIGFAVRNVGIITDMKNPSAELSTYFTNDPEWTPLNSFMNTSDIHPQSPMTQESRTRLYLIQ